MTWIIHYIKYSKTCKTAFIMTIVQLVPKGESIIGSGSSTGMNIYNTNPK